MALSDLILAVRNLQTAHELLEEAKRRKTATQAMLAQINEDISQAQNALITAKQAAKQLANQEL